MDLITTDQDFVEQVEVIDDLLEECWFFDNLLNRRSRVLRYCHSDPFPSCSSPPPKPKSTQKSINLASEKTLEASTGRGLLRTPSLPPCVERGETAKKMGKLTRQLSEKVRVHDPRPGSNYLLKKEPVVQHKGRESSRRNKESSCGGSLQRTQTLPSYIGRDEVDEFHDHESDARLGFLIREAIASSSGFMPPKQNVSKVSSIPRHRPPRNSRSEECIQQIITQGSPSYKTLRKTVSNIETEEIHGLKDLQMGSNKHDSSLRDKKQQDQEQKIMTMMMKAKRAEEPRAAAVAGRGRCTSAGPPIPAWAQKDSRRDMKAQIKFWARAVASNVRQEC